MSEPAIQRGRGGRMPPFCDVARTPAPEASLLIWMCTHPRTAFRPSRGLDNRTWEDGFRKRRLSWSHWRPWPGYCRCPLSIPPSPALSPPRFVDNRVSTTLTRLLSCICAGRRDGDWTCPNCSAHVYATRVGALPHPSPPHHPGTHTYTAHARAHTQGLTCTVALRCKECYRCRTARPGGGAAPRGGVIRDNAARGGFAGSGGFLGPFSGGPPRREGDWTCPMCKANVYASRVACFRCQTLKPPGAPSVPSHGRPARGRGFGGPFSGWSWRRPGDWTCPTCRLCFSSPPLVYAFNSLLCLCPAFHQQGVTACAWLCCAESTCMPHAQRAFGATRQRARLMKMARDSRQERRQTAYSTRARHSKIKHCLRRRAVFRSCRLRR